MPDRTKTTRKPAGPAPGARRESVKELIEPLVDYIAANDDPSAAVADAVELLLARSPAARAATARELVSLRA